MLPLSHQDIGHWLYTRHPWPFALPLDAAGGFTKPFLGSAAIEQATDAPYTLTFVGHDLRKIDTHTAVVRDATGPRARHGAHLRDRHGDRPRQRREDLQRGDAEQAGGAEDRRAERGFIKVGENLAPGTVVELKDARRSIKVTIETDVRPDRTARKALKSFL